MSRLNRGSSVSSHSKGQITMFMVVGILILLVFGVLLYILRTDEVEVPVDIKEDAKPVYVYVDKCISIKADEAIKLMGIQGGRLFLAEKRLATQDFDTSYGIYDNKKMLTSKEIMEAELELYLSESIKECSEDFSEFPALEISASPEDSLFVDVIINTDSVKIDVDYPIEVRSDEGESIISEFKVDSIRPIGRLHSIAEIIVEEQIKNPDQIDMSSLSDHEADVSLVPVSDDSFIVSIIHEGYIFMFGAKLILNKPPVMNIPESFQIKKGQVWRYEIDCIDPEGEDVFVVEDSALISTSEDGYIESTPYIPGSYEIEFTCTDDKGAYVQKKIEVEVVE